MRHVNRSGERRVEISMTLRGVRRVFTAWLAIVAVVVSVQTSPAHADTGDPVGAFDTLSVVFGSATARGSAGSDKSFWVITGWAVDPDAPGQSLEVHVYVDGQRAYVWGPTVTGDPRPDVDAAIPGAGPNAGWSTFLPVPNVGPHTFCVYAINVGPGSNNTTLGCKTAPLGTSIADPQGNLEAITSTPGFVRLQGWAGDGDAPSATPVRVVQDGQIWESRVATLDRTDVHAAFPAFHNAGGFDIALPVTPGKHIFCVDLGNGGPNGVVNTSLGCRLVSVPDVTASGGDDASGSLELVQQISGMAWEARGWAWDPKSPDPATVRLYAVYAGFWVYQDAFAEDVTASDARPDIANSHPGAPQNTGFHQYYGSNPLVLNGVVYVCATVLDGPLERFIGCRAPTD